MLQILVVQSADAESQPLTRRAPVLHGLWLQLWLYVQQLGSASQICLTHGSQAQSSFAPVSHLLCAQVAAVLGCQQ